MNIRSLSLMLIPVLMLSSTAMAAVELELSGGSSTKNFEEEDSTEATKITSTDLSLYVGYQFKNFFSFGLIASQKNYDLKEAAKSLSSTADAFYSDSDVFTDGPAVEETGKSSGSLKGLVYGPQITISYPWKYFQPYLRLSYQMGTLKSVAEYKSTSSYGPAPIAYDIKIEDDRKTTFTQYGIGFRIPISMAYIFVDAGVEQMNYKIENSTVSSHIVLDTDTYDSKEKVDGSMSDKAGGSLVKLGFGFEF